MDNWGKCILDKETACKRTRGRSISAHTRASKRAGVAGAEQNRRCSSRLERLLEPDRYTGLSRL